MTNFTTMKNKLKKKRQICKRGDVLAIPLMKGKKYMYLRCLDEGEEFFDYVSDKQIIDISILEKTKILFMIGVYRDVLGSTQWPKIGKLEPRADIKEPLLFAYDPYFKRLKYYQYGEFFGHPSAKECYDLEEVAAWDKHHIEERLESYIKTGRDHPRDWYMAEDMAEYFKKNM